MGTFGNSRGTTPASDDESEMAAEAELAAAAAAAEAAEDAFAAVAAAEVEAEEFAAATATAAVVAATAEKPVDDDFSGRGARGLTVRFDSDDDEPREATIQPRAHQPYRQHEPDHEDVEVEEGGEDSRGEAEEEAAEVEDDGNVSGGTAIREAVLVTRRPGSSHFKGVSWHKSSGKWEARRQGKFLGYHATEDAAAQAYDNYVNDGIAPVRRRATTSASQFKGVTWDKSCGKWKAICKGKSLGYHATVGRCRLTLSNPC